MWKVFNMELYFNMIEKSHMFNFNHPHLESVHRPGRSRSARAYVLQTGKDTAILALALVISGYLCYLV